MHIHVLMLCIKIFKLPNFGVTSKIRKKSNFDRNQLKRIRTCIRIRKKYKNVEFSTFHF